MTRDTDIQEYIRRGFSLVPFKAIRPDAGKTKWGKRPLVKWESRAQQRPDPKTVIAEFKKYPDALIGCCTGGVSGIVNLDVDSDEGRERADELVPDSLMVPTYKTISGGVQMIFRAPDPCPPGAVRFLPGLDFRGKGSVTILPPSNLGYSWLEGLSLAECEPPGMPSALLSAIYKTNKYYKGGVDSGADGADFFSEGRRDNDLFTLALALVKQNLPEKLIRQTLEMVAQKCNPPFPLKEAEAKIRSAMQRAARRERNLAGEVREWVLSTNGIFTSTEVAKCQQLSTRGELQNLSMILKRCCDEGLIERYGNRNGQFRRIDTELEPLDWLHADTTPLSLQWPFGIERLVNLYPGNLAVVAGAPNAGKTALILNFIRMNQDRHEIHLFTSEGGKEELHMRIAKMNCPLNSWKFSAWGRSGDWPDVIRPDAINIVDYLELHDDFYKVGGILKSISDKLKQGFALVALQKNIGRDEGLGGARSLEKPRLYLAMDHGRTKIVKAKSWADGRLNPNGMSISWKLIDGCKFLNETAWRHEG